MVEIAATIERVGWMPQGVFPTVDDPPTTPSFTYTIGLTKTFDHPELIIYGVAPERAHGILACAVELIEAGTRFAPGECYGKILKDQDVLAREVQAPGYPLNIARAYYGADVSAIQLVWPDAHGVFPLEEGFDPELNGLQCFPDGSEADA